MFRPNIFVRLKRLEDECFKLSEAVFGIDHPDSRQVVTINAPAAAVQGVLTQAQVNTLMDNLGNYISFNSCDYIFAGDKSEMGYLEYTHMHHAGVLETITVNINTLAWVLTKEEISDGRD